MNNDQEYIDSINVMHQEAELMQINTINQMEDFLNSRIKVASIVALVKDNKGSSFARWWRDNNMPIGWADKYLTISKTANTISWQDKSQLKLIGIIADDAIDSQDDKDNHNRAKEANPFEWVKMAGRLRSSITLETINAMDQYEKQTAKIHLKPFYDMYLALNE